MKILHCSDVGSDCKAVVKANTEEEVIKIAAEHARTVHGVTTTREIAEQIKTLIKEDEAVEGSS